MIAWLKARLVPDWKGAWKWWTLRLHALGIAALLFIYENPTAIPELLRQLPEPYRGMVPPVVLAGWALLVPLARLWKQRSQSGGK